MKINELIKKTADSMGLTVEELGDPFLPERKLPEPLKFWCSKHERWWYPSDQVCCPECVSMNGSQR